MFDPPVLSAGYLLERSASHRRGERRERRWSEFLLTTRVALINVQADVFLEKRDSHELERNGLVAIFLRGKLGLTSWSETNLTRNGAVVLEYFSGSKSVCPRTLLKHRLSRLRDLQS